MDGGSWHWLFQGKERFALTANEGVFVCLVCFILFFEQKALILLALIRVPAKSGNVLPATPEATGLVV